MRNYPYKKQRTTFLLLQISQLIQKIKIGICQTAQVKTLAALTMEQKCKHLKILTCHNRLILLSGYSLGNTSDILLWKQHGYSRVFYRNLSLVTIQNVFKTILVLENNPFSNKVKQHFNSLISKWGPMYLIKKNATLIGF